MATLNVKDVIHPQPVPTCGRLSLATDEAMQKRRRVFGDPLRHRMARLLTGGKGMTAKERAERLRVDANRLYHHLRVLEEAGVIAVVTHKVVGQTPERVYKVIYGRPYIWDPKDPEDLEMNLAAILEATRVDAEFAMYEGARRLEEGKEAPYVTYGAPSFSTTREEMALFAEQVFELQNEFRARGQELAKTTDNLHKMAFTYVVYEEPETG